MSIELNASSYQYLLFCREKERLSELCKTTREKGRYLTRMYDKSLTPTEQSKKQGDNTKTPPKNVDYTTIADRLRTVSWGNDSHQTGVVKPVYGIPTFPLH